MDAAKLAAAVRGMREKVDIIMDANIPEIEAVSDELRDVKCLLGVLAHIVDGKPITKAFGAPGDWGYGTPIANALISRG